jgi:hypothetical protein
MMAAASKKRKKSNQNDLLDGAFWQNLNDGRALHLNFNAIGNLNAQEAIAQLAHFAQETTGRDDFIAFGQRIDHGLVFFCFFIWGRIMTKYSTTNIKSKGNMLIKEDCMSPPAAAAGAGLGKCG